jgi:hypothetical protein
MARRSYGSGRLFVRSDSNGRETWYRSWRVGGRRIKRQIGVKRRASTAQGLTRTQAEAELRRLMATEVVLAGPQRKPIEEAGALYVERPEHVMERKRTTIHDYRGYLRPPPRAVLRRAADGQDRPRVRRELSADQEARGAVVQDGLQPPQLPAWVVGRSRSSASGR